jgi:hypothetical protein
MYYTVAGAAAELQRVVENISEQAGILTAYQHVALLCCCALCVWFWRVTADWRST